MGRWRALGARQRPPTRRRCAGARGYVRRRWSSSAAATGAARGARHGGVGGRSTGSSCRAGGGAGARAGLPARGASRRSTGARTRDDGAYDLAVLSHVVEHVAGAPAAAAPSRPGRPGCWSRCRSRPTARRRRPAKRAEGRSRPHPGRSTGRRSAPLAPRRPARGPELTDPLPYAHHVFFAAGTSPRSRARLKTGGAARGSAAPRPRGRSACSPSTTLPRAAALAWRA